MTQFSLFGAAVAEPCLDDLDGVLLAGGHWVRSTSDVRSSSDAGAVVETSARLSVVVADLWRAEALAQAFAARGVAGPDAIVAADGGHSVRTAFHADLDPLAQRWTHGASEGPPTGFALTAGGLRLWAIATGHRDDIGYLLGTADVDEPNHIAGGAQLARMGIAAVSITGRAGGPGWRIISAKRLRRFAELVGERPTGGADEWPF